MTIGQQDFAYIDFWSVRRSSRASSRWKLLGKCQPDWYSLIPLLILMFSITVNECNLYVTYFHIFIHVLAKYVQELGVATMKESELLKLWCLTIIGSMGSVSFFSASPPSLSVFCFRLLDDFLDKVVFRLYYFWYFWFLITILLTEIRIARIFNTYGPRMNIDDGRVVSNFIAQAVRYVPLVNNQFFIFLNSFPSN